MIIYTLITVLCTTWFCWRGYRSGIRRWMMSALIFLSSLACTSFTLIGLIPFISAENLSFPWYLLPFILLIFYWLLIYSTIRFAGSRGAAELARWDRLVGMGLGMAQGLLLSLVYVWCAFALASVGLSFNESRRYGEALSFNNKTGAAVSASILLVTNVTDFLLRVVDSREETRVLAGRFIASPGETSAQLQSSLRSAEAHQLFSSVIALRAMRESDFGTLVKSPEFQGFANLREFRWILNNTDDQLTVEKTMYVADKTLAFYQFVEAINNDAEIHALLDQYSSTTGGEPRWALRILFDARVSRLINIIVFQPDIFPSDSVL